MPAPTVTPDPVTVSEPEPSDENDNNDSNGSSNDGDNTVEPTPTPAEAPVASDDSDAGYNDGGSNSNGTGGDSNPEPTATPQPEPTATPQPEPTATPQPEPAAQPTASIQQLVDDAASGATVTVPAGIYRETVTITKPITLVAEPGAEIRGDDEQGNVVRENWIVGRASNVTIDGFTMRYANNPVQTGALNTNGYDNWTIRNNTLSHAAGANVSLMQGGNLRLINNVIHDGGQLGVHGYASSNVEVTGNTIYNNNTDGHNASWEAGGLKFAWVTEAVVADNHVYDNAGPGIWFDIDADNATIRENRVHHNSHSGIIFELSRNAQITNNLVWENGHGVSEGPGRAGIFIQNSRENDVANNIVAWNGGGIVVWSEDRGGHDRWNQVVDNTVRNNSIFIKSVRQWDEYGLAWIEFQWTNGMGDASANNRGSDNRYYHANPSEASWNTFMFAGERYDWNNLNGFNNTRGENNGQVMSETQKNQTLNNAGVPASPER